MRLKLPMRWLACSVVVLGGIAVKAAPLNLPAYAVPEDAFFVATVELSKADPAALEATVKALLGEKAGEADGDLKIYKTYYEKYAGFGAERITVVMRGDPDKQKSPEPMLYVKFKAGAEHVAAEKQIRADEGENNPLPMEITHDGDFMLVRAKGQMPPTEGSEGRTKLFAEALGNSEKPVVGALIFNEALLREAKNSPAQGQPPGFQSMVSDPKWYLFEITLGEASKAEVTIQTADEEVAKRVADAVTGIGDFVKAQAAQMKQQFANMPKQALQQLGPMAEMADAMTTMAEAFKPTQMGSKVMATFDAPAAGGMLRLFLFTQRMMAQNAPPPKGGL